MPSPRLTTAHKEKERGREREKPIYIQPLLRAPSLAKLALVLVRKANTAPVYCSPASKSLTEVLMDLALACLT